jgi:rapamycin-insensitive companion of mTOR
MNRANSVEDAVRRGQRQVEQVKVRMGMQMDDRAFQASLLETQVYHYFFGLTFSLC